MDTKYWQQAYTEWCNDHLIDGYIPNGPQPCLTPLNLSQILDRAQQLKVAAVKTGLQAKLVNQVNYGH
jgi:hypothetical protein